MQYRVLHVQENLASAESQFSQHPSLESLLLRARRELSACSSAMPIERILYTVRNCVALSPAETHFEICWLRYLKAAPSIGAEKGWPRVGKAYQVTGRAWKQDGGISCRLRAEIYSERRPKFATDVVRNRSHGMLTGMHPDDLSREDMKVNSIIMDPSIPTSSIITQRLHPVVV